MMQRIIACVAVLLWCVGNLQMISATERMPSDRVQWAGALRNVHKGLDFSGKIDLNSLSNRKNLYAVGPVEDLKGEITVWDSTPLVAEVKDSKVVVEHDWSKKACFLVYGQMASWQSIQMKDAISEQTISQQIQSASRTAQVPTDKPFVFLLKGRAQMVRLHVLNKTDNALPNGTTEQHDRAKVHFTLSDQPVEILGFYSEHHQGIFTHHDSFVHMHVKSADNKIAGHVESLELEPGTTLYLPAATNVRNQKL